MNLTRHHKPLYVQIKNILKDRVLHGHYPLHGKLPSEPRLEEEFGVSKITIRNAIKELVQEGYLETSSGRGTTVIRNTSPAKRSSWKRFTEVLVEEGHRMEKELLRVETAATVPGSEAHRLLGERCLRIERLYRLNGEPYIHYVHYVPERFGPVAASELHAQSLYGWLEERGAELARFRDAFSAAAAAPSTAALLGVELRTPLLKRTRCACDEAGETMEYSEGFYQAGLHPYVVDYEV
ncbi:GntR family transcriptional regulator [Paenibacillus athensensis]|uniref:GntR family transcriptional regulator n=1 Tax=Paenibacillus athensensis TaxID=1967502 RepID=A0A4Y8PY13_9BACL|nr:GntR family transcriptional regulator [Paenibacillus athensensis]MCD1258050.1 GntR family transcriptional regulator [Paenibacillus athensensis]